MFYWSSYPFVRLVIPFILGILLYSYRSPEPSQVNSFLLLFLFLIFSLVITHIRIKSYHLRWLGGALTTVIIVLLGYCYSYQYNKSAEPPLLKRAVSYKWLGEVQSVAEKEGSIHLLEVKVTKLKEETAWSDCNFNLLVYNQDKELTIEEGDLIGCSGYLSEISEPKNPVQFSYKSFLENKQIYYSTFEDTYERQVGSFSILSVASRLRKEIMQAYRAMGFQHEELAVLTALTLGDKSQLNPELREAYAGAGAMHILAVSGLHVGIIFLLFSWLLSKLPKIKVVRFLKAILLLFVIWSFALISGFSPSVQRAAWMFSFIIVSDALKRNSNIINSIAASAFLLVLINPLIIYQLGFQLSYSAVIGIVLLYPQLYALLYIKNKWLNKVWSLMVVSIAAQLATLPLTLYYFHQFPNYFLLTNLLVIPLAFGIVFLAVCLSVLYFLLGTSLYLNFVMDFMLYCLNKVVQLVNTFPHAISEGIWIDEISLLLLLVTIAYLIAFLKLKTARHFIVCLTVVFFFSLNELMDDLRNRNNERLTFYALQHPGFSIVNGLEGEVYLNDEISSAYEIKLIKNDLESKGVRKIKWNGLSQQPNKEKYIDSPAGIIGLNVKSEKMKMVSREIDYLITDEEVLIDSLLFESELVIVDYSLKKKSIAKKVDHFAKAYHRPKKEGALVINF